MRDGDGARRGAAAGELIGSRTVFAALLIMGATSVVALFYCLDALQGERRDRSILFWKSLPVSDVTTVLSKASIPLVILPVITVRDHSGDAVAHVAAQQRGAGWERRGRGDAVVAICRCCR